LRDVERAALRAQFGAHRGAGPTWRTIWASSSDRCTAGSMHWAKSRPPARYVVSNAAIGLEAHLPGGETIAPEPPRAPGANVIGVFVSVTEMPQDE
ncbi:MAG: hypothetical protein ABI661_12110, partial [Gammaproteobacteria bacterium]